MRGEKDTKLDGFIKRTIGLVFVVILVKIFPVLLIAIFIATPFYIMYILCKVICNLYRRKIIPQLPVWKLKREFRKRSSPFYGWKYELLFPPNYFPWDEVIMMTLMPKKRWIPEQQFHLNDTEKIVVHPEDDEEGSEAGFEPYECQHENFITGYHSGNRNYRNLIFKEEGLLHICLTCQKQIGYDGVGLN